jgi:hypothetical protein
MNYLTIAAASPWEPYDHPGKGKKLPVDEFSNYGLAFMLFSVSWYAVLKARGSRKTNK